MTEFKKALKEMMERKLKEIEEKEVLIMKAYDNKTICYINSSELHETELISDNLRRIKNMKEVIEGYIETEQVSDEELLSKILTDAPFSRHSKILSFFIKEKERNKEEKKDEIVMSTVKDILLLYKAM